MFEVGDIVEISFHGNNYAVMPNAPAINLQGSVAKVIKKEKIGYLDDQRYKYKLSFIKIIAKNMTLVSGEEGTMAWRDEHLVMAVDVEDTDIIQIIKSAV